MNRKTLLTLVLILIGFLSASAQDVKPERKHEIGLGITAMDGNFNLSYKVGSEKTLFRMKTVFIDYFLNTTNIGLSLGVEFRKPIGDRLDFVYGNDLYDSFLSNPDAIVNIFGLNFVIGANYHLTKNVIIGAEITPLIGLTAVKPENSHVWERDFLYNLNTAGAELIIAVEF